MLHNREFYIFYLCLCFRHHVSYYSCQTSQKCCAQIIWMKVPLQWIYPLPAWNNHASLYPFHWYRNKEVYSTWRCELLHISLYDFQYKTAHNIWEVCNVILAGKAQMFCSCWDYSLWRLVRDCWVLLRMWSLHLKIGEKLGGHRLLHCQTGLYIRLASSLI